MNLTKILVFIFFVSLSSCKKVWEPPTVYTVNLSLAVEPDSVDINKTYYYANGMKLQIRLIVKSDGGFVKDEVWTDKSNFHWGDSLSSVSLTGKVIDLSGDTANKIENYPLYMRVYQGSKILYDKVQVENNFSL